MIIKDDDIDGTSYRLTGWHANGAVIAFAVLWATFGFVLRGLL